MQLVSRKSKIVNGNWLPDMDLNHDKQIQSLLCYHYTIRHCECGKDSEFCAGVKDAENPKRGPCLANIASS